MREPGSPDGRIIAIDWMRGVVMVLMAIDHASIMFNSGRLAFDSSYPLESLGYVVGTPLPLAQFMTRWITHICAPTFLFLSGTSLALSVERRLAGEESAWSIDRHLLIRGLILIGLDLTYISLGIRFGAGLVLQVLFAIGASLILMVPLRRLSSGWLVGLGLLWLVGGEALTLAVAPIAGNTSLLAALSVAPVEWPRLIVMYPALPWCAMMALGWAFGRHLLRRRDQPDGGWSTERLCAAGGLLGLAVFALVRGLNAYGNLVLYRGDASLAQWLHTSKYPPSLAFASIELGLMGLCLAALFALARRVAQPREGNPVLVFGQTALFFYLAHFAVLFLMLLASGQARGGLGITYLAASLALVPLYPLCLWYRRYKAAHRSGWLQYI